MMHGCLPSEEQDLNEQEELESVEVKPKKGKKLAVKVGAFVLAGSIVGSIVAWDYFNSNVNVDVPLEDIVAEQSEESVLDEKIAEKLHIPIGTVKSRINSARKILSEELKFLIEEDYQ